MQYLAACTRAVIVCIARQTCRWRKNSKVRFDRNCCRLGYVEKVPGSDAPLLTREPPLAAFKTLDKQHLPSPIRTSGSDSVKLPPATRKGTDPMTKARARQRAKAKAAKKIKKRQAAAGLPGPTIRPGQFDPQKSSIKGPVENANTLNFAGAKSGAARSR